MKRLVVAALALTMCVPRGTDPDPRGGAEVTFLPSDVTLGKAAIVTPDGWTLSIDYFAFLGQVAASHVDYDVFGMAHASSGGTGPALFLRGGPECPVRLTSVEPGLAGLEPQLPQSYLEGGSGNTAACSNVDAATLARFRKPADNNPFAGVPPPGPNVIVRAHATKDGKTVTIDAALAVDVASEVPYKINIVANEGVPFSVPVYAERIFVPTDADGIAFQHTVDADADGDGIITGAEIGAYMCKGCVPGVDEDLGTDSDAGVTDLGDDDDGFQPSYDGYALIDILSESNAIYMFGQQRLAFDANGDPFKVHDPDAGFYGH